jgi:hypothetical protein
VHFVSCASLAQSQNMKMRQKCFFNRIVAGKDRVFEIQVVDSLKVLRYQGIDSAEVLPIDIVTVNITVKRQAICSLRIPPHHHHSQIRGPCALYVKSCRKNHIDSTST